MDISTIFLAILGIFIWLFESITSVFRSPWAWVFVGFFIMLIVINAAARDAINRISSLEDNIDNRLSTMEDEIKKLKFMLKRIADVSGADLPEDEDEYPYLLDEDEV